MSDVNQEIELPEIEQEADPTEALMNQVVQEEDDPLASLTMDELNQLETGEVGADLQAKLDALGVTTVTATDDDHDGDDTPPAEAADAEEISGNPVADADKLLSLQANQQQTAPAYKDWDSELGTLAEQESALESKLAEIARQVEDGDKLESEVMAERRQIEKQLRGLDFQQQQLQHEKAQFGAYVQQQQQAWQQTCEQFIGQTNKAFYLNADGSQNAERLQDLDVFLKSTAKANPGMSDVQVLQLAHDKVARAHGYAPAAEKPAAVAKPAAKPVLPTVLGNLPRAASPTDSPWAALDNAKGDALIGAIGNMTEAQMKAWSRS